MTESNLRTRRDLLLPAGLIAAGLLVAACAWGIFFYAAQRPVRTVAVVGSASREFSADRIKWRLSISRQVGDGQLPQGFASVRDDVAQIRARLVSAGVPDTAITLQPPSAQPQFSPQGGRSGYSVVQPLYIVSDGIDNVESIALDPAQFLSDGMALDYSQLEYFYSGIAELKHALLGDATRDAHRRAEEITASAGGSVGSLSSARAGVFQITEPLSTEVSGYGVHNTSTRRKEITVTVHSEFRLR